MIHIKDVADERGDFCCWIISKSFRIKLHFVWQWILFRVAQTAAWMRSKIWSGQSADNHNQHSPTPRGQDIQSRANQCRSIQ